MDKNIHHQFKDIKLKRNEIDHILLKDVKKDTNKQKIRLNNIDPETGALSFLTIFSIKDKVYVFNKMQL